MKAWLESGSNESGPIGSSTFAFTPGVRGGRTHAR
jgi:hypothetical protein